MDPSVPADPEEVEPPLQALHALQRAAVADPPPAWPTILRLAAEVLGRQPVWFRERPHVPWRCSCERPQPPGELPVTELDQTAFATEPHPWAAIVHGALASFARRRDAETRYATLRDISFEGLCIHRNGHILEVNQALAELYGYTREQMIGMHMTDTVAPEILDEILALVRQGHQGAYETLAITASGERLPLEARGKEVVFAGETVRVASFRDIRDRKAAEHASARARQAAEEANRQKSAFLANISHELRTPLNAVLGIAQLLRAQADHDVELVGQLIASASDLLALVDDLLDLTRIEEGRLELQERPFHLGQLLERVREAAPTPTAGVSLALHTAPDAAAWYFGDERRIRQILLNLLTNAVKFTAAGHIALRVAPTDTGLCFAVEDTGIGIPADRVEQLFQRFEQGAIDQSYGGSGLGLHISRSLAEHMGGELAVESVEGEGSTFSFTAPLSAAEPPLEESTDPPMDRDRPLAVLLAEDNPVNQLVVRRMVESLGHAVVLASNGQQALDAAGEVDVVLMDVQMPVLDGVEATRRLRRQHPKLPVIGLTAHAMADELARCREAGMREVLTKPVDLERLRRALIAV